LAKNKRQELTRFLKFCVVGVIGTAIDFGLFNLLHNVLGLHQVLSNTLSVTASIVNNYTWSRFWVYPETKDQQGGAKFVRFVIVSIMAWALNTAILWSSERWLFGTQGLFSWMVGPVAQLLGTEHTVLSSNAAKVLATGIVLFWNFFANRYWTFRDVDQVSAEQPPVAVGEQAG
jgi:putative flippase GtrA